MPQSKLKNFFSSSKIEDIYKKAITSQSKAFEFKAKELTRISPGILLHLHQCVMNKLKENPSHSQWVEDEKKVFNWIFLCFLHVHGKTVAQLDNRDYQYLADVTTNKPVELIKYHVHGSLKQEKRPKWSETEDKILFQILAVQKKYPAVGQWSHISKDLFLRGDQESFKSGKNCRERWYNHVNPALNKIWTTQEDLILMNFIKTKGKKWSSIIPELNNTKSEHMIKNRYHSLLRKKGVISEKKQSSAVEVIIEELIKQNQKKTLVGMESQEKATTKRVLRSDSFKKLKEEKKEPHEELLKSQFITVGNGTNCSQLLEEEGQKNYGFRIMDAVREDPDPEEVKPGKQFDPYGSIKFQMSSPAPPTPALFSSISYMLPPFERQYDFKSCSKDFHSSLKQ